MKRVISIIILLLIAVPSYGQEGSIGFVEDLEYIAPIELPSINLQNLRREDSINDLDKTLPWRYGVDRPIVLNLEETGRWTVLDNGDKIWQVAIKSPDAINMSVNFGEFFLPEGSKLQMYNADKTDSSRIYSASDNRFSRILGSWFVEGDIINIEYFEPEGVSADAQIEIGSIIHGYRLGKVNSLVPQTRGLDDSGDCNYDVNCFAGADFEGKKDIVKKAVALLNLGNGYLCSAALMNNTSGDRKPFLLSANHCLEESDPALWSVRFNWVSPTPICGFEDQSADVQSNFTMSGAQLRASNAATDFALVELVNEIPASWDVSFAGWDNSDNPPLYQVGIHHPNGDIMKLSRDDDPAVKENANGVDVWLIKGVSAGNGNGWELGTTESGSSGSPLFSSNGYVIGQLYAGQSFCNGTENNGDYDVYGRLGVSWNLGDSPANRLKDWLDPINSGQQTVETLENALSTTDFEITGQLQIFPNPASEYIMIMNTRYPKLSYRFFNVLGQEVQAGDVSSSENRISVENMSNGVYFLQLFDEESQQDITKKILVQR